MKLLQNQVVLVTGGTRGIGLGIVKKCAEHGANIAFTYRSSAAQADEVVQMLAQYGVTAKGYASDAADYAAAEKLIADIIADFADLNVVINNAGITKDGLLLRMNEEQWDQVLDTNLKSVFNITKHASKHLMKKRKGVFINMSSVVGKHGNAGQANYAASKAGIIGFSQSIAKELGSRNIRCNVVAPGFIQTEMTESLSEEVIKGWNELIPLKRPGTTNDVAELCVFLASDNASYITGQVFNVCGGLYI